MEFKLVQTSFYSCQMEFKLVQISLYFQMEFKLAQTSFYAVKWSFKPISTLSNGVLTSLNLFWVGLEFLFVLYLEDVEKANSLL